MTLHHSIPLTELAEMITAAFEEFPSDPPEDRRGGRLFRAVLLNRLRERFGEDWVRSWDYVGRRKPKPTGVRP